MLVAVVPVVFAVLLFAATGRLEPLWCLALCPVTVLAWLVEQRRSARPARAGEARSAARAVVDAEEQAALALAEERAGIEEDWPMGAALVTRLADGDRSMRCVGDLGGGGPRRRLVAIGRGVAAGSRLDQAPLQPVVVDVASGITIVAGWAVARSIARNVVLQLIASSITTDVRELPGALEMPGALDVLNALDRLQPQAADSSGPVTGATGTGTADVGATGSGAARATGHGAVLLVAGVEVRMIDAHTVDVVAGTALGLAANPAAGVAGSVGLRRVRRGVVLVVGLDGIATLWCTAGPTTIVPAVLGRAQARLAVAAGPQPDRRRAATASDGGDADRSDLRCSAGDREPEFRNELVDGLRGDAADRRQETQTDDR